MTSPSKKQVLHRKGLSASYKGAKGLNNMAALETLATLHKLAEDRENYWTMGKMEEEGLIVHQKTLEQMARGDLLLEKTFRIGKTRPKAWKITPLGLMRVRR